MWLKGSRKPQQCQYSIKTCQCFLLHPFLLHCLSEKTSLPQPLWNSATALISTIKNVTMFQFSNGWVSVLWEKINNVCDNALPRLYTDATHMKWVTGKWYELIYYCNLCHSFPLHNAAPYHPLKFIKTIHCFLISTYLWALIWNENCFLIDTFFHLDKNRKMLNTKG